MGSEPHCPPVTSSNTGAGGCTSRPWWPERPGAVVCAGSHFTDGVACAVIDPGVILIELEQRAAAVGGRLCRGDRRAGRDGHGAVVEEHAGVDALLDLVATDLVEDAGQGRRGAVEIVAALSVRRGDQADLARPNAEGLARGIRGRVVRVAVVVGEVAEAAARRDRRREGRRLGAEGDVGARRNDGAVAACRCCRA